ncbi:MAG: HAD-IB family hydrolase [Pseudomonadota bacterium]
MKTGPVVAAFDFDGTLTQGDTLLPFLARGLGWPRFLLALLKCAPWLVGYALRLVPNDVAKQRLLMATLQGRSLLEINQWTTRWLDEDFSSRLRTNSMARLDWHLEQGHCCVMVSASPDIYLQRVARQLGFEGLLCTEMAVQGGRLTGLMRTPNCHGEQKVVRLKAWLAERFGTQAGGLTMYAYGDTAGDLPMLQMAGSGLAWYRGKPWKEASSRGRRAGV